MPTLPLTLAVASVTSSTLKRGHRKHASNGKSEVLSEIATFLEVAMLRPCAHNHASLSHFLTNYFHSTDEGVRNRHVNELV